MNTPTSADALEWARSFCEHKRNNRWVLEDIDEGLMIGWFANYWATVHDPLARRISKLRAENERLKKDDEYSGYLLGAQSIKIAELTQQLDALHGTPCEQIRHAQEIEDKDKRIAELEFDKETLVKTYNQLFDEAQNMQAENAQCKEAFAAASEGRPIGPLVEKHLIANMQDILEELRAQIKEDDELIEAQKREIEVLHGVRDENERLRKGLSEALDWNWLDDDAPRYIYERLLKLIRNNAATEGSEESDENNNR